MLNTSDARNYVRVICREEAGEAYEPRRLRNAGSVEAHPLDTNRVEVGVPLPYLHIADLTTDELAEKMESRSGRGTGVEVYVKEP